MRIFFICLTALLVATATNLSAGDENAKEKKKQSDANPKAATVSMDVEIKGMVVKEDKELRKNKGTKPVYYLVSLEDNRKYEMPVPDAKDDPKHPEIFVGKNVVVKGTTEVSSKYARITTVTSIKEQK